MRPVIALLTDFGTRDHYVGTMKGVILGIASDVVLVDLTHEIAPHDVLHGALQLAASCRYFPAGTIFVAVVDPGVGTHRRGIAVAAGKYQFVAPDNGLLTSVLADTPPDQIVELSEPRYALPAISRTFEGRDRFAPAAAWLARGTHLGALGAALLDCHRLDLPTPEVQDESLRGVVLFADRFGNLVTNIDRRMFEQFHRGQPIRMSVAGAAIAGVVETYAEIAPGAVCALFGSSDHLELAARAASAADRLGCAAGAVVEIARVSAE